MASRPPMPDQAERLSIRLRHAAGIGVAPPVRPSTITMTCRLSLQRDAPAEAPERSGAPPPRVGAGPLRRRRSVVPGAPPAAQRPVSAVRARRELLPDRLQLPQVIDVVARPHGEDHVRFLVPAFRMG